MSKKFNSCPYCPYVTTKWINIKGHLAYKHPFEPQVVKELYSKDGDE